MTTAKHVRFIRNPALISLQTARTAFWASLSVLSSTAAAQNENLTLCDPTRSGHAEWHPGSAFDSGAWLQRGQCIRHVDNYNQCLSNLETVLENLSSVIQTECSAAATVLTLLPTMGALCGSPSSEIWSLTQIFPVGGFLVQCLSFGGSMMPSHCDGFLRVLTTQGCITVRVPSGTGIDLNNASSPIENFNTTSDGIIERIHHLVGRKKTSKARRLPVRCLLVLGCSALAIFVAASMAALSVIEQGAVYSNWCTSTWWAHTWYLVGKLRLDPTRSN
jgi:hypothetical protein